MVRVRALTLVEVIVTVGVLTVLVLLTMYILPAPGGRHHPSMQSNGQVRGIQQAMVLYGQGNNTYYPGLDSLGELDTPEEDGGDGRDPDWRMEIMLTNNFFTGEYVVSPVDVKTVWTTGAVDSTMYPYALLDLDQSPERAEWRDTINTEAVVVSDRNTGSGTKEAELNSLWTGRRGDWRGSVGWNDNHTTFETEAVGYTTKYGSLFNDQNDNLFQDDDVARGDAQMVYGDPDVSTE